MQFTDYIHQFLQALQDEIASVRKVGGTKVYLSDGRYLGEYNQQHTYSFTADSELRFPDDTPADISYQGQRYSGVVTSVIGFDLFINLQDYLGASIATAILYTEPWFLLQKLCERLSALSTLPIEQRNLLLTLLGDNDVPVANPISLHAPNTTTAASGMQSELNQYQRNAVTRALSLPISFIWGPPGTGKSKTLGAAVAELVQRNASVLVMAHSNVAVDGAMQYIAECLDQSSAYMEGKVLRVGPSHTLDLKQYPHLSVREVARQRSPALMQRIEQLEHSKAHLLRQMRQAHVANDVRADLEQELRLTRDALQPYIQQLRVVESALVQQAVVVGCTLSKATITPDIYERAFQAVIIDEASMAYIPHCVFAASLATHHIAHFGDFRQLAPISQASTNMAKRWLQRDIFDQAGVISNVEQRKPDSRLSLLRRQYRMNPKISTVVNDLFYGGYLNDAADVAERTQYIVDRHPSAGQALITIDVSHLQAQCFTDPSSYSRFNIVSAIQSVQSAIQAIRAGQGNVGIITPYAAQSRLINRLVRDLGYDARQIQVATVHKYQGSERDVIIFDTVDGNPKRPGLLTIGDAGTTAARLANVAISRARGKFIVICNYDYLQAKLSHVDSFWQLISRTSKDGVMTKPTWSPLPTQLEDGLVHYPTKASAQQALVDDMDAAKEEIAITTPVELSQRNFPIHMLRAYDPSRIRVFMTAKQERDLPSGIANSHKRTGRVTVSTNVVGIDRAIIWFTLDALNAASPVLRISAPGSVKLLYSLLDLVPPGESKQATLTERIDAGGGLFGLCPQCGQILNYDENHYSLYIRCTNDGCDYTRRFSDADATTYARLIGLTCDLCGGQVIGRRAAGGVFLACINYPECRWRKSLQSLI